MSDRQGALDALTSSMAARAAAQTTPEATVSPTPPPNVRPIRDLPAGSQDAHPASGTDAPSVDPNAPVETLAERVERAINPEPGRTQATPPTTEGDPTTPVLSERELEFQRRADEAESKLREIESQDEEAQFDANWEQVWDFGYDRFQKMGMRAAQTMRKDGRSDEEIDSYILREILPLQQQWERETTANEKAETRKFYAQRNQPNALEQLISQHGLSAEDRATLAKYKDPDVRKMVAADLGARVSRVALRDQQVVQTARDEEAARLSSGFGPGAPASGGPVEKQAHKFTAEEHASGAAAGAISTVLTDRFRRRADGQRSA